MSAIIARLTPWIAGGAIALILALGSLWQVETWRREAAQQRVTALQGELATANAALADRANIIAAMDRQEAATRRLQDELEPTRRAIYAAPRTTACVASPVVRAGIASLRTARAGPAAAIPGVVAGPAGLPAAPAGAGDRTGR